MIRRNCGLALPCVSKSNAVLPAIQAGIQGRLVTGGIALLNPGWILTARWADRHLAGLPCPFGKSAEQGCEGVVVSMAR